MSRYCIRALASLLTIFTGALFAGTLSAQPQVESLHPRPKACYERESISAVFTVAPSSTVIVIADTVRLTTQRAIGYLNRFTKAKFGDTLRVTRLAQYDGTSRAIFIGEADQNPVSIEVQKVLTPGEILPTAGGYVLDVMPMRAVLAGVDSNGVFNGISTLVQLMGSGSIRAAHVWDYPDFPIRWVFSLHNLRGVGALDQLRKIEDTMALRKLNGLQQNDFKYAILEEQPAYYFTNADSIKQYSHERNIDIIPGVAPIGYSEGILWHDNNLAEGFPTTARYIVQADTARLIADPQVSIPNGNFEKYNGNTFSNFAFIDGPGQSTFVDEGVTHTGSASIRMQDFVTGNASGNCRVARSMKCQPDRYYVLSAWIRADQLSADEVKLLALGTNAKGVNRTLAFTAFSVSDFGPTWRKVQVGFNTHDVENLTVYVGIWGGHSGKMWVDDFEITDGGLMNILRRNGTPLHVKKATGEQLAEGKDFLPVVDSVMLSQRGSFHTTHAAPPLVRIKSGAIKNGDTLIVSSYHPVTNVEDVNEFGSVMVCVSEDSLYGVLKDQFTRVEALHHPRSYFLSHDEVRAMNHDSICTAQNKTPGDLLAENANRCRDILRQITPNADLFIWSDMFDAFHNAVDNYYLVKGTLAGDAEKLAKDITIVNWNSFDTKKSTKYFSDLGFSQISSPYYDVGNTSSIRVWRKQMEGVPFMRGSMYTTWSSDYRFLSAFADYMWSAGPFIIHTPLDSSVAKLIELGDSIRIEAVIHTDSYDPSDRIDSAYVEVAYNKPDKNAPEIEVYPMQKNADGKYIAFAHHVPDFWYRIIAVNAQGYTRETPHYRVLNSAHPVNSVNQRASPSVRLSPNPAGTLATLRFEPANSGLWSIEVVDVLGATVLRLDASQDSRAQRVERSFDVSGLANGHYTCKVIPVGGGSVVTVPLVIAH